MQRNSGVRNELKLLAALSFFANGSYQRVVGTSYLLGMAQPTLSKCIHEVTAALNAREIIIKHIKFPTRVPERVEIMESFMRKFGFPGIIGCIDGTHVAIICPVQHEETFLNRKHYHSLNVLIIRDINLKILYIDASYGGAAHDSFVWNQSPIKEYMETLHRNGECCWLMGDSGYAQRPWMMTPIVGAAPNTPEEQFTDIHCSVRNTVERCIGVLKARWRCLLAHRVLHYAPEKAARMVNACAVLHNIATAYNVAVPELHRDEVEQDLRRQIDDLAADRAPPRSNREQVVQRLWAMRH